jgi:DNA-binding transcriptional LysR family regulator
MDLDQLHTFLEIVRLKSFSKAALSCFRTQPAVSAQVRQLEHELNTSLFERLGTKIALTAAGRIFADYAEQILDLRRRAQDSINELERVPRGELVIAASEGICIHILPVVFSDYKKRFPNVQMLIDRSFGARAVEAVVDNQADFGVTQLPVKEKRVQVVKIHTDEIKVVLPPGHPLAGQARIVAGDLVGHPLLLPKSGSTRSRLNAWLEPVEESVQISMELDSTEMIKRFVLAGMGVGFVAGAHCREEVTAGRLVALPLAPDSMPRQIGLIYRKDKALSKAALGFIEVTLSHAALDVARLSPRSATGERPAAKSVPAEG